jgi:hypothetical protein
MKALKRLSLAMAIALAGVACGDDDKPSDNLDGGIGLDGSIRDNNDGGDAALPCTSYTPAANGKCGGSHCLQTEAELRASALANATCGKDIEISSFCSLQAVKVVADCTLAAVSNISDDAAFTSSINTCVAPDADPATNNRLPEGFSSACSSCFVESAKCAANKCLIQCGANPNTVACDTCRINQGCISSFYKCAGITNPLDALGPQP